MAPRATPKAADPASRRAKLQRLLPSGAGEHVGPEFLRRLADVYPLAMFVEIGAHDGTHNDPLRDFVLLRRWGGVMVEPVPNLFERLRRNYGGLDRVALENAAISDLDGRRPLYHLAPVDDPEGEGLPFFYDQIASLSRETLLGHRHLIPDMESRLVCTWVECMTFETLCRKHRLGELDALVIDAEGHDWTILRGVDLEAHRPRLIVYEHAHLAPDEREGCRNHLERHGYDTREEGFNTWCLHARAGARLYRTWRRLRWRVPGTSVHDQAGDASPASD